MSSLPILQQEPTATHTPGPRERAVAHAWSVARARLHRWGWLRASWSLHRRFQLRMVRLGELRVVIPAGEVPDCESCVELCCTGPNAIVSLRLRDIAALMDAGLEHAIVRRDLDEATRPTGKSGTIRHTWARREADSSVFHRAFPVLARDRTHTCALLTEDRRCGAWPAWPLSCARYPYALDLQMKVVFWASGCTSKMTLPVGEAPPRVRTLVRAVVDAYNERVKDIITVSLARAELRDIGVLRHIDEAQLGVLPG